MRGILISERHSEMKYTLVHATCRRLSFALSVAIACAWSPAVAQTLLSQYLFDGDLTNNSIFVDTNGDPAPDGTFRRGTDSATAVGDTPTFVNGVDGSANGAILFDGTDGWVDVTTAGHPGAPVGIVGTPTDDDPFASSGPGLNSGTAMAWVRSTNTTGARWIMGNLNADTPPFITDSQAWLMGWDGGRLQVFPRASNSGVSRFIVADPTNSTSWADGSWHHIAFRWNGSAENGSGEPEYAAVFIDGVNLGAASTNFFLDETDGQNDWQFPMAIGARNNRGTLDGFFDGAIDDLRIYSDFLSDSEIQAIFNAVTPVNDDPDFDGDGDVDLADLMILQRGFGVGSTQSEGDADGNGVIDAADLAIWEGAFDGGAVSAAAVVPEPASLGLSLAGLLLVFRKRR